MEFVFVSYRKVDYKLFNNSSRPLLRLNFKKRISNRERGKGCIILNQDKGEKLSKGIQTKPKDAVKQENGEIIILLKILDNKYSLVVTTKITKAAINF
jgi:hypothetical protein